MLTYHNEIAHRTTIRWNNVQTNTHIVSHQIQCNANCLPEHMDSMYLWDHRLQKYLQGIDIHMWCHPSIYGLQSQANIHIKQQMKNSTKTNSEENEAPNMRYTQ